MYPFFSTETAKQRHADDVAFACEFHLAREARRGRKVRADESASLDGSGRTRPGRRRITRR